MKKSTAIGECNPIFSSSLLRVIDYACARWLTSTKTQTHARVTANEMREIESHKRERATKMAKIVAYDLNESSTWKYIKEIEKKNFTHDTKQSQVL